MRSGVTKKRNAGGRRTRKCARGVEGRPNRGPVVIHPSSANMVCYLETLDRQACQMLVLCVVAEIFAGLPFVIVLVSRDCVDRASFLLLFHNIHTYTPLALYSLYFTARCSLFVSVRRTKLIVCRSWRGPGCNHCNFTPYCHLKICLLYTAFLYPLKRLTMIMIQTPGNIIYDKGHMIICDNIFLNIELLP